MNIASPCRTDQVSYMGTMFNMFIIEKSMRDYILVVQG